MTGPHLHGANVAAVPGCASQVSLGQQSLSLDHGGVLVAVWPDAESMVSDIETVGQRPDITIRLVGGALIADLNLYDNLTLEAALGDGSLPRHLIPEMDSLLTSAGCPVDWAAWESMFPDTATADAVMQAKVGRALMADPDVLVIDAAEWDDALLSAQRFSHSYTQQYPWRGLVWATHDMNLAIALRGALKEFQA